MPISSTNDIIHRRDRVIGYLAQKYTLTKIAKLCNVSIDTIIEDKKQIERQGHEFWNNVANKTHVAYNQFMIMINIEKVISKCWSIVESRNKHVTQRDKLSAMKLILEAGNYEEKLFVDTPTLLELKELEEREARSENKGKRINLMKDNGIYPLENKIKKIDECKI